MYACVVNLMETVMKTWILALLTASALSGCGYNDFQRLDEETKSAWSEVLNQYQRRADLVATMLGTRSARRWYWFSTSLQADLVCSSRL